MPLTWGFLSERLMGNGQIGRREPTHKVCWSRVMHLMLQSVRQPYDLRVHGGLSDRKRQDAGWDARGERIGTAGVRRVPSASSEWHCEIAPCDGSGTAERAHQGRSRRPGVCLARRSGGPRELSVSDKAHPCGRAVPGEVPVRVRPGRVGRSPRGFVRRNCRFIEAASSRMPPRSFAAVRSLRR
jgi:hypothetical protein